MRSIWLLPILLMALVGGFANAQTNGATLGLDEFLHQVREKNSEVSGQSKVASGAADQIGMIGLLNFPTLVGDFSVTDDKRITDAPIFMGNETKSSIFQLGVRETTTFGLDAKLTYNVLYRNILGISPGFVTSPHYYDAYPKLELTQSLWQNFLGAQTKAGIEAFEAQKLAESYASSYRVKRLLADAEATYWRLALARDNVAVQRESLDRSQKIRDWNAKRVNLHLADRADLLQAEAALETRQLEVQTALDDERTASRAFNLARGVDSDKVTDDIVKLDSETMNQMKAPTDHAVLRDDVKAAQQNERAATARAENDLQTLTPDIKLYGSYALTYRDETISSAFSDSFRTDHPYWTVGLRFVAPLDIVEILKSRSAVKLQQIGASENYDRKVFEQDSEWKDLNIKFSEIKRRLELSRQIEGAQKQKLTFEKDRLRLGRSTTYQVLLFEQDYASAQLVRIRLQADILNVIAQLKTFGGSSL